MLFISSAPFSANASYSVLTDTGTVADQEGEQRIYIKARNKLAILNVILAFIYFVISCGGVYVLNIENIKALSYKRNIKFDTISAQEMAITKGEKDLCAKWFNDNFFSINADYPFTFKVDGEEFDPAEWDLGMSEAPDFGAVYQGGKTENIILTNKNNGLNRKCDSDRLNLCQKHQSFVPSLSKHLKTPIKRILRLRLL